MRDRATARAVRETAEPFDFAVRYSGSSTHVCWERRLYGGALHIPAQGSPHAESVVSFYGVPGERVGVVGCGANFHPLPPLNSEPRERVVLFVSGEWHRQGGERLADLYRRAAVYCLPSRYDPYGLCFRSNV